MKEAKCPNCGGNIVVDEKKEIGICQFCNAPFITEKAIAQVSNNTSNNAQTIINNYYNAPTTGQTGGVVKNEAPSIFNRSSSPINDRSKEDPRPRLNVLLAVFLCCMYFLPGVIYIAYVKGEQKKWDRRHGIED